MSGMEMKICRICGQLGTTHQDIFKIDGLKHKIETCLPIFVTQHCLLPDNICLECLENVTKFYCFIKKCLQKIIILESQYDITESCLKSKRRHEKSCSVNFSAPRKTQETQTDVYDIIFTKYSEENIQKIQLPNQGCDIKLVDYEVDSEASESENKLHNKGVGIVKMKTPVKVDNVLERLISRSIFTQQYFDNFENNLIHDLALRKGLKRGSDIIRNLPPKICKFENASRRKNKIPKKIKITEKPEINGTNDNKLETVDYGQHEENQLEDTGIFLSKKLQKESMEIGSNFFQNKVTSPLMLDNEIMGGPVALAMYNLENKLDNDKTKENRLDKKKKIPNLLKIFDIKRSSSSDENQQESNSSNNDQKDFPCQICVCAFSTKQELYQHCRSEHPVELPLMCGICFQPMTSVTNLRNHLKVCAIEYPVKTRYFCAICKYGDDSMREMENHVLIHDFLIIMCRTQVMMFDPANYVELNNSCELGPVSPSSKNLSCSLCFQSNFLSFKDFSNHRRDQHSKFHCDLCNKFYGRNSHLWKHVNRLHKNHPSITCQICLKTSASKYHLGQHFSKIHSTKPKSGTSGDINNIELENSFRNFEFPKQEKKSTSSEYDEVSNNVASDQETSDEVFINNASVPKEVDASSHLYTNIITNYTPPNGGEFKCPKCFKGFTKKLLLKKHKKNCRPKLQKDLLTRCKTCSRIFKDRQSLAKHLVNYHSEYTCEICSQKAQSKCEIVSHIRFSHTNCHLFCKLCGNILRSQQDLLDHTNDHSNSYICQFCGDSIPSKIKLKMHILSLHRKILSLSCGICLKLFENQHILKNHVQLVHKNDLRPFTSCTVCGKNYGSKWKTYDHLNKSHGRIFKVCKTCLKIFNTEEELNVHCEDEHSPKNQNASTVKNSEFNDYLKQDIEEVETDSCKEEIEDIGNGTEAVYGSFAPEISATKISLLEKRLLGKNIYEETEFKQEENETNPNVTKTKLVPKKENVRYEEDNMAQQSSSKRTVYVDSDVPSLCEICFKTWPAKKHLWQHYIRCHKSVAATVCGICLKTNVDYRTLQKHLQQNHPTLLHGKGYGSNFICRICGRYHNASSKLKLHMAIHENFDWSILDEKMMNNDKIKIEDNDTYYESLIEQVECSSNEDEESEDEQKKECERSAQSSSSEESGSESVYEENKMFPCDSSENSRVESEQLNGNKTFAQPSAEYISTESDSSSESCSSEDEEMEVNEERSNNASSNEVILVNSYTNSSSNPIMVNTMGDSIPFTDNGLFRFKTEELDSAVKSISLECESRVKENLEIEYCELSIGNALNDGEIESAVGSIL